MSNAESPSLEQMQAYTNAPSSADDDEYEKITEQSNDEGKNAATVSHRMKEGGTEEKKESLDETKSVVQHIPHSDPLDKRHFSSSSGGEHSSKKQKIEASKGGIKNENDDDDEDNNENDEDDEDDEEGGTGGAGGAFCDTSRDS